MKKFPSNYIIPKNISIKQTNNLLIVSYNEMRETYDKDDLLYY